MWKSIIKVNPHLSIARRRTRVLKVTQSSRTEQKGGRDVMKVEQNTSSKATKV
jgi:hypothetical protein